MAESRAGEAAPWQHVAVKSKLFHCIYPFFFSFNIQTIPAPAAY